MRTRVPGSFKGTPIQVGNHLLMCTGQNIVLSLDPDSGEERWRWRAGVGDAFTYRFYGQIIRFLSHGRFQRSKRFSITTVPALI